MRCSFAAPRSRPCVDRVGLDHAHQEIAQQFPLARFERREDPFVGGYVVREQTTIELLALRGQIDMPSPSVSVHDASPDHSPFLELRDDDARAVAVNAETCGGSDLVE